MSDTKLRLFIQAQEAVNNVQDQYQQAAQNPGSETANSLQRNMGEEIVRTIKQRGLTVDEYNTIFQRYKAQILTRPNAITI